MSCVWRGADVVFVNSRVSKMMATVPRLYYLLSRVTSAQWTLLRTSDFQPTRKHISSLTVLIYLNIYIIACSIRWIQFFCFYIAKSNKKWELSSHNATSTLLAIQSVGIPLSLSLVSSVLGLSMICNTTGFYPLFEMCCIIPSYPTICMSSDCILFIIITLVHGGTAWVGYVHIGLFAYQWLPHLIHPGVVSK